MIALKMTRLSIAQSYELIIPNCQSGSAWLEQKSFLQRVMICWSYSWRRLSLSVWMLAYVEWLVVQALSCPSSPLRNNWARQRTLKNEQLPAAGECPTKRSGAHWVHDPYLDKISHQSISKFGSEHDQGGAPEANIDCKCTGLLAFPWKDGASVEWGTARRARNTYTKKASAHMVVV